MNKRRLITSPLEWASMKSIPVPPPHIPALAERGGTQLRTPLPVLLVDSREQDPFDFQPYARWFSGIKKAPLQLGDYAIEGMEDCCVVERKSLSDLVKSLQGERDVFVRRLRLMAEYSDRLLVVDAPMSQVRSRYEHSLANPNRITQSLFAAIVGLRIQTFFAETHDQGAEMVAWYLYNAHLYHWLEQNDLERMISDNDL
jgi:ERCC4-type nuclease